MTLATKTTTKTTAYRKTTALATAIAIVASLILPAIALAATEYNANPGNTLNLNQAFAFTGEKSGGTYTAPSDGWVLLGVQGKHYSGYDDDYYSNGSAKITFLDGSEKTIVSGTGSTATASEKYVTLYVNKGTKLNITNGTVEGVFVNSSAGSEKDLLVNGTSTLNGATAVNSNFTVTGETGLSGNTSIGNNLTVAGNTTTQTATVKENLSVEGNTYLGNSLADTVTVAGSQTVAGNLDVAQEITAKSLDVTTYTTLKGNVTAESDLVVRGSLKTGSLSVAGNEYLTSTGIDAADKTITNLAKATQNNEAAAYGQTAGTLDYANDTLTLKDRSGNIIDSVEIKGGSGNGSTTDKNAVHYDTDIEGKRQNSVTFGTSTNTQITLKNIAAGGLSETSTDAVTGAQLYETNINLDALDTALDKATADIATLNTQTKTNTDTITAINNSAAMNSGITAEKVANYDAYKTSIQKNTNTSANNKTAIETINNSAVMNSGITSAKVQKYDGYQQQIDTKADKTTALKSVQISNTGVMTQTTANGITTQVAKLVGTSDITSASLNGKTVVITSTDAYTGTQKQTELDLSSLEAQTVIQNGDTKYQGDGKNVAIETKEETEGSGKYITTLKLTDELTDITSITTKPNEQGKTTTLTEKGLSVAGGASALTENQLTIGTTSLTEDKLTIKGTEYINENGINANGGTVTGLKDGEISATSTDAVTGKQLYETNSKLDNAVIDINKELSQETQRAKNSEAVYVNGENVNKGNGIELIAGKNVDITVEDNAVVINSVGIEDTNAVHYDTDAAGNRTNTVTFYDAEGKTKETGGEAVTLKNVTIENLAGGTGGNTSTTVESGSIEVASEKQVSGGDTENSNIKISDGNITIDNEKESGAEGTADSSNITIGEGNISIDHEKENSGEGTSDSTNIKIGDGGISIDNTKENTTEQKADTSSIKIGDGVISVEEKETDTATGETKTKSIITIEDGTIKTSRLDPNSENWEGIRYADNPSIVDTIVELDKQVSMISGNQENMTKEQMRELSAQATATESTAIGYGSIASGIGATAVGYGNNVSGIHSTGVGYKNTVSGNYSGAFGDPNTVTGDNSYAIGNNNNISGSNTFAIGNSITTTANNAIILGVNSTATEDNVVSVGSKGSERKIVNVAEGTIANGSTDAVTGGQLYTEQQERIKADNELAEAIAQRATGSISALKGELESVAAQSAALAGLKFVEPSGEEGDKFTGAVAYGGYGGKSAGAVGLAYKPTENVMINAATSFGDNQSSYNAGVSFKFGKGNTKQSRNAAQQKEIQTLTQRVAMLEQFIKQSSVVSRQSSAGGSRQTLQTPRTPQTLQNPQTLPADFTLESIEDLLY